MFLAEQEVESKWEVLSEPMAQFMKGIFTEANVNFKGDPLKFEVRVSANRVQIIDSLKVWAIFDDVGIALSMKMPQEFHERIFWRYTYLALLPYVIDKETRDMVLDVLKTGDRASMMQWLRHYESQKRVLQAA